MGELVDNHLVKSRFFYLLIVLFAIFLGIISVFSLKIFFLILLAIPLTILTFLKPEIGLLIYITTLPFREYMPRTPGLEFISVAVFLKLLIFISLIMKLAKKKIKFVNAPQNWAILGFTSIALISTLVASNLNYSFKYFYDLFHILILYFLIIHLIDTEKLLRWTILVLVLSGFIAALFGISQYLLGWGLVQGRIVGPIGEPNDFANFLVGIIPLAFFSLKAQKSNISKMILFLICFILFFAVIFTFSRGGLIALIIVLFLIFLKQKKKFSILSVFLILFLILSTFIPLSFWLRSATLVGYQNEDYDQITIILRAKYWAAGIKMFLKNFLFGVGPGNFKAVLPFESNIRKQISPHNIYIEILTELGIFGFIFFSILIFLVYKNIKKFKYKFLSKGLEISFISFLISGLFLSINFYIIWFWIIIALSATLKIQYEKNKYFAGN